MLHPRAHFAIMVLFCVLLPAGCWARMILSRKGGAKRTARRLHDTARLLLVLAFLSVVIVACMAGILTELQLRLTAVFGPVLGITGGALHLLESTRPHDGQDDQGDGCRELLKRRSAVPGSPEAPEPGVGGAKHP